MELSAILQRFFAVPLSESTSTSIAYESKDSASPPAERSLLPLEGLLVHLDANCIDPLIFDKRTNLVLWRDLSDVGNDAVSLSNVAVPTIASVDITPLCYPITLAYNSMLTPASVQVVRFSSDSAMVLPAFKTDSDTQDNWQQVPLIASSMPRKSGLTAPFTIILVDRYMGRGKKRNFFQRFFNKL